MKKFLSLLCTISIFASMFVGCSSEQPSTKENVKEPEVTSSEPVDVNVVALKGPTSMGISKFMLESDNGEIKDNNYNFEIVASIDEVTPKIVKGDVDIAAVPANLASVLYNNTKGEIDVLAINTLGVLYIMENGDSVSSVEDLRGKTIYASGKGATPEYALNYILSQNGIDPSKDVNIEWKSEHAECVAALMSKDAIAMLPQPFVTVAQTKNENIKASLDLTKEWNNLQEGSKTPSALVTGVVVARKDFIENNPDAVNAFLNHYKTSVDFVNNNVEEAAKIIGDYNIVPTPVAQKAIPNCNIVLIEGNEMKEKLSGYFKVLMEQNPASIGGELPKDDFYYKG